MHSRKLRGWGTLALVLFTALGNAQDHGHDHGDHDHGDHGHGHGHGDERAIAFTIWTDAVEIFAEHPFAVVGKPTAFVTHVTDLKTFLPRTQGSVTFVTSKGAKRNEHREPAPARNGIYIPELVFPEPGTWIVTLQIPMDGTTHDVPFPSVQVYPTQEEADRAPDPEEVDGFSFLKEQQWIIPFMVESTGSRTAEGVACRTIPESALAYADSSAYVYVQLGGETFERRGVQVKGRQDGLALISSGLTERDHVVTLGVGSVALAHGQPCGHDAADVIEITDEQVKRFDIVCEAAISGGVGAWLQVPGEIEINHERMAHIVPHVKGRVARVDVDLGQDVRAGQVLALIESRELADAKAEFLGAREHEAIARAQYEREERLYQQKISTEEDYLTRKEALARAAIRRRAAGQKLRALGLTGEALDKLPEQADDALTSYIMTAPFNGTIIEKHMVLGEVVDDASETFIIADLSTVWVDLHVSQKDIGSVSVGQPAEILLGGTAEGVRSEVSYVDRRLDPVTRTAVVRIVLDDPERRYRSGTFVTGRIGIQPPGQSIVIPAEAVQIVNDRPCVFIDTPEGFALRYVTLGHKDAGKTEILDGVDSGEQIVVRNAFHLKAEITKQAVSGHGHVH